MIECEWALKRERERESNSKREPVYVEERDSVCVSVYVCVKDYM